MNQKIITLYRRAVGSLAWPQSLLLLLLRVVWGWGFVEAGWGKFHSLEKVTGFFTSLGIPAPGFHALLVATVETGCGLLLLMGLFARLAALPLIGTMIVAYFTAESESLHALLSAEYMKFFEAAPWPFLLACLLVLLFGPGRLSLDALLSRYNGGTAESGNAARADS